MWMGPRRPRSHGLAVSECLGEMFSEREGLQRGVLNRGQGRKVVLMFVCERECRLLEGQEVRRMRRWN
jgi:hypothetical protein